MQKRRPKVDYTFSFFNAVKEGAAEAIGVPCMLIKEYFSFVFSKINK